MVKINLFPSMSFICFRWACRTTKIENCVICCMCTWTAMYSSFVPMLIVFVVGYRLFYWWTYDCAVTQRTDIPDCLPPRSTLPPTGKIQFELITDETLHAYHPYLHILLALLHRCTYIQGGPKLAHFFERLNFIKYWSIFISLTKSGVYL